MAFVETEDILKTFEGLMKNILFETKGIKIDEVPRMTYADAIRYYGTDKPDLRFEMKIKNLESVCKGSGLKFSDSAETVLGVVVPGGAEFTRKQIDSLTDWVKRPQIGATGMIYCKFNEGGENKSSVDKFFDASALNSWKEISGASDGDMLFTF